MLRDEYQTILVERVDDRLFVTLNRPEVRNALNARMIHELSKILDILENDRSIRVLILQGAGGVFCAGGDIKQFKKIFQGELSTIQIAKANRQVGTLLTRLDKLPQTVMTLIDGAAIGGGLGLVCVSDVAITTAGARFSISETSLGVPPAQIAAFVVKRIGMTQARRLMLTGARFKGDVAAQLGLVHFTVADALGLDTKGDEILQQIDQCGPIANAVTKEILHTAQELPLKDALDIASHRFANAMLSREGIEGVAAFLEKRPAQWPPSLK